MTSTQRKVDEIAAAYERWSYGEGYSAGRVDGGRTAWRDGYTHGFDVGAETGGARVLLDLESVIGRERLDELIRAADGRMAHVGGWLDYRARTSYEPVAGREEWRGTENGAQLPAWDAVDDDTDEL